MFKNFLQSKCPQTVYIRLNQIVSLCFNTLISKPIHSEEDIETLDYDVMPFIYLIFFLYLSVICITASVLCTAWMLWSCVIFCVYVWGQKGMMSKLRVLADVTLHIFRKFYCWCSSKFFPIQSIIVLLCSTLAC